jgi:hypothetical protein
VAADFPHPGRSTAAVLAAEMRSRFWMGGRHVTLRMGTSLAGRGLRPIAARQLLEARDLIVHCAQ